MKITIDGKPHETEKTAIADILKELNINREEYIVAKNGTITHENTNLQENDRIDLIKIISGG